MKLKRGFLLGFVFLLSYFQLAHSTSNSQLTFPSNGMVVYAPTPPPHVTGWGGFFIWEVDRYTNEENDSARKSPMSTVFSGEVASNAEMAMNYMKARGYNAARVWWEPPTSTTWVPYNEAQLQKWINLAKGLNMWIVAGCSTYFDQYQYEDQWINHWQGVISKFKDSYDKIIWEPANEPVMQWNDGSHALEGRQAVNELARIYQRWIDMCRNMGDTHWIVVSAVCWWNSLPYEDWFPTVNDPLNKIYIGAHFYYFYEWNQDKWTVTDAEAYADSKFSDIQAVIAKHNRPFICTEYSAFCYSDNYGYNDVPTAQYDGAAGYSTISLAFAKRLTQHFKSAGISYLLYPAGQWSKDWSQGWHYGGLYGGMDVWGQYL
jgi:hypothetical protein